MLEQAKEYVAKGWSVIPLRPKGKKPAIDAWREFQDRLPTEAELQGWFKAGENNIGIVTGRVSNLTVIDVDEVTAEWTQVLLTHDLLDTYQVQTGKGTHLYYSYRPDVRTTVGFVAGVDIRSDGGYVVAPPSVHESGARYVVANSGPLASCDEFFASPPAPVPLPSGPPPKSSASTTRYGQAILDRIYGELPNAELGTRNDALNKAAFTIGQYIAGGEIGLDDEETIKLGLINIATHDLQESYRQARQTVESGLGKGKENPASAPPKDDDAFYEPINVHLNGSDAHTWVERGRVPGGYLSILAGQQKVGKGLVTSDLIARVTQGESPGSYWGVKKRVLVSYTEDDYRTDVLPRLEAAGADTALVFNIKPHHRTLDARNLAQLEKAVTELGVVLVVLDQLADHIPHPPGSESWQNQDGLVRPPLVGCQDVAKRTRAAILGVLHDRKGIAVGLESVAGAQAWTSVPRVTLRTVRSLSNKNGVLKVVANNVASLATDKAFSITHTEEGVPLVHWTQPRDQTTS